MSELEKISSPEDIKKLNSGEIKILSQEIRDFLIENISQTGGHLASNLGVVELTLALHYVFDTPSDKIIWDVGHQAYVHKIITGRKEGFNTLRQIGGLSGFPKISESVYDSFNTGHSSTSISAALGLAKARDIKNGNYSVVAVIGDGALTGGMAFEALNNTGRSHSNLIVILNDNEMSISKNVGSMSNYLSRMRIEPFYFKVKRWIDSFLMRLPRIGKSTIKLLELIKGTLKYVITPGIIFEELGFRYLGPIDGHDFVGLKKVLSTAKSLNGPTLIHVCTQKGKGYTHAEEKPHLFHGISPFEIETGEILKSGGYSNYSDVFGAEIEKLASENKKVVAITAAMRHGTGLEKFSKDFNERFFDVGIAEQHAVTFAAGLAVGGLIPVVAVYSSFLQRSYDQILHDVALQNLHVVFAIDRAGIVGEDGETHQGIYDLSYLTHIPNMTILAPGDYDEFTEMIKYAVLRHKGPIAVRYPRGKGPQNLYDRVPVEYRKGLKPAEGRDITIVAAGCMVEIALQAAEQLGKIGISADVINPRFIKPLDEKLILASVHKTHAVITIEDNVTVGGFGSEVLSLLSREKLDAKVKTLGLPDKVIEQGSRGLLLEKYGLCAETLAREAKTLVSNFNS